LSELNFELRSVSIGSVKTIDNQIHDGAVVGNLFGSMAGWPVERQGQRGLADELGE